MLVLNFAFPQITLDRVVNKAAKKAEQRAERKIDKTIDKGLDKIENSIDGKDDKKDAKEKNSKQKSDNENAASEKEESKTQNKTADGVKLEGKSTNENNLVWSKFDFIPGDVIIFEDNLQGEKNGEFPSKWDLVSGSVENANFNRENVIMFINSNTNSYGGIVPLMKSSTEDYLPSEFTIEFDAYFDSPNRLYRLLFYDGKNQNSLNRSVNSGHNSSTDRVRISQNSADYHNTSGNYPGFGESSSRDASRSKPGWRRISISFNKRALKVYIDDARVLNIPNMSYNPLGITIAYHNPSGEHQGYLKNIRIAEGAVPLYDKFLTDGKIITNGIRFDVGKASLRPESMGVINEIYNFMNKQHDIKFSVEGHTDSDGNQTTNQKLSEDRAKAVMDKLIELGIDKSRLAYKGFGQSKPVAENTTPEGKAQNRRVEFVKI